MKIMNTEDAIKSIFIQCLNDPEVVKFIKTKLQNVEIINDIPDEKVRYSDNDMEKNSCLMDIVQKLDKILENQSLIQKNIMTNENKEKENLELVEKTKREYEEKIAYYKGQQERYQQENIEIKTNLEILNRDIQVKAERIKNFEEKYFVCNEIIEIWNCVKLLEEENRKYINELAGGDGILSIISLGRDERKIEQLWSFLRDTAVKGYVEREEDLRLNRYFEFCIKVYNSTQPDEEKYHVSEIGIGDEFNMNQEIKTADSRQIGKIQEVIVKRYFTKSNKGYKAIVKVG